MKEMVTRAEQRKWKILKKSQKQKAEMMKQR